MGTTVHLSLFLKFAAYKYHLYLCSFIYQLSNNHSPLRYSISVMLGMEYVSGFYNLTLNQSLAASLTLKITVHLTVRRKSGCDVFQHFPCLCS